MIFRPFFFVGRLPWNGLFGYLFDLILFSFSIYYSIITLRLISIDGEDHAQNVTCGNDLLVNLGKHLSVRQSRHDDKNLTRLKASRIPRKRIY